jgi:hypothetical protein
LPVQLVSFTARVVTNQNVELNWRTISEINNYGFFVQKRRAESGEQWADIPNSFIAGYGTTNIPHDYSFTDGNVSSGNWQYRLRQVDLDGSEHFNEPVQVSIVTSVSEQVPSEFKLYQNYPNPFNPATEIRFSVEQYGHTQLRVYDLLGREVATLFADVAEPNKLYVVQLQSAQLASGVYLYRLNAGARNVTKQLVVLR